MARNLSHKQFLQLWYNRCGLNNKTIQSHMEEIYNGLLTTISEELRLNGELRLKNFGRFYVIKTGGYERKAAMLAGGDKYFVPVHYTPKFTASNNLKDYVNDAIVSKEGRRNKKDRSLTPLQQELIQRDEEKSKNDIRRILERKMATGENVGKITKDSRMTLVRRED